MTAESLAPHPSSRFSSLLSIHKVQQRCVQLIVRSAVGIFFLLPVTGGLFQSGVCEDQLTACERRADFKANKSISASKTSKEVKGENSTVGAASPQPPSAAAASAGLAAPALSSEPLAD